MCSLDSKMAKIKNEVRKTEVTPWCNKEEFVRVHEALFSRDVYKVKWGLDRIKVWGHRCYPALPACIDATASLSRAMLTDEFIIQGKVYGDDFGTCLMYSPAIIRFVNLMCECVQNDFSRISVRKAAKKLGIPAWIVDLRHKATHSGDLPDIDILRKGAQAATHWLENEFWNKYVTGIEDFVMPEIVLKNRFEKLITSYKDTQLKILQEPVHSLERKRLQSELKVTLNHIKNHLQKKSDDFYEGLLKPSIFFNDQEYLKSSIVEEKEHFLLISTSPEMSLENLDLPKSMVALWVPLIATLNSADQIPQFVYQLLKRQKNLKPFHQKVACAWALKLILFATKEDDSAETDDPVAMIFRKHNWTFDWYLVTLTCAMHPSPYVAIIIKMAIDLIYYPLSEAKKRDILWLFALRVSVSDSSSRNKATRLHEIIKRPLTWQDFQEEALIQVEMRSDSTVSLPRPNFWKTSTDVKDWSSVPLGFVFGPNEDFIGHPVQPSLEQIAEETKETQPEKDPIVIEESFEIDTQPILKPDIENEEPIEKRKRSPQAMDINEDDMDANLY